MKRTKTLRAALLLALAIAALVAAGPASAAKLVGGKGATQIVGTPSSAHTIRGAVKTVCNSPAAFSGPFTSPGGEFTSTSFGEYTSCTGEFGSYKTNGCQVTLHVTGGTFDLGSGGCGPLTRTICESLYPKAGMSATYENIVVGSEPEVIVRVSGEKLKYANTCGFGSGESGVYEGSWTLDARNGAGAGVGLRVAQKPSLYIDGEKSSEGSKQPKWDAEELPMQVQGSASLENTNLFKLKTRITCSSLSLAGSVPAPGSPLALSPTATECRVGGSIPAVVKGNGCSYRLFLNNESPVYRGAVDLSCPTGNEMTLECKGAGGAVIGTVSIPPQTLGTVSYENAGPSLEKYVVANMTASGIRWTESAGGECAQGSGTTGSFKGSATLTGAPAF